ncbi:MAG: hypothetical protein MUP81_06480 [Dehalococcoidia bacterium]|nr:hypothetical protein [Dehalococcoidia bacterium]
MNQLAVEKQRAIIQGYNHGIGIRMIADIVQCSPITARKYLRLDRGELRTISEGMVKYHKLRRGQIRRMSEHYDITPIVKTVLSCGKTRNDCINCRDIFGEGCGFNFYRRS